MSARDGYEQAIATLRGVFERTGSPAAKWAADPQQVHAEALACLDRQIEQAQGIRKRARRIAAAIADPGRLVGMSDGWDLWPDVADLAGQAIRDAEGRRSILRRHAPVFRRGQWECSHCSAVHNGRIVRWEDCPDARDAAAGLPEDPDAR